MEERQLSIDEFVKIKTFVDRRCIYSRENIGYMTNENTGRYWTLYTYDTGHVITIYMD